MRIVLIGAPGAGKGTYAQYFRDKYCIPHISTGDIFREEIAKNTDVGKVARVYIERGELVPDGIVNEIIRNRLREPDVKRGFILDGYPRTIVQARYLDQITSIDSAIHLVVSEETAVKRLSGRRICPVCNRVYNIYFEPKPRSNELCDYDGSKLIRRQDDEPEIVKNRYRVFYETFKPILNYYREKSILIEIDANRSIREVVPELEYILVKRSVLKIEPCRSDLKPG